MLTALPLAEPDRGAGIEPAAPWPGWVQDHTEALIGIPLRIALVIAVLAVVRWVAKRAITRVVRHVLEPAGGDGDAPSRSPGRCLVVLHRDRSLGRQRREQRARTIGSVLSSAVPITLSLVGVAMVLDQVGIALGPLMASAGVVGLAIGFGAQSLVADYLSGLLITVEDQYGVGDSVDLGEAVGEVERVGLRLTHVRDLNGGLRHIRNGEILRVRNDSQDWARAVLDVAVAYDANLDTVYRVLEEAGQGLRQEPAFADLLLEDPAVWGVQSLDADGVIVRIAVKATPLQQWAVTRELRRRVKDALDEAGIDIPFPPARHLAAYGGRGRRSRAVCSVTFGEVAGLPRGADPPPGSTLGSFLWYEAHRWDGRIVAGEAGGGDVASERAAASDSVRRGGPAARARRDRRGGAGRRGLEGLRQPRPGRVRCGGGTRRACTAVGCGPSSPGGQGPGAGAGATGAGRGQHAGRRTDTTPRSCLRQGDTAMPGPEASGPLAGPRKT